MPRIEFEYGVDYRNIAGQIHRNGDLPAREWNDGDKEWWVEGKCHRLDNPAGIGNSGTKFWLLNGIVYSKSDYYSNLYLYKGILNA